MRLSDLHISPISLALTTVVAATLGVATMVWPASNVPDASMPVMYEELTITITAVAAEPAVVINLRSARANWLVGEAVTFEAQIQNLSTEAVTVSAAGLYDLAVQKLSSPSPEGLGEVTFLALSEVGRSSSIHLAPGEIAMRLVKLGADQPFDEPGRYRVSGAWLGGDAPAAVAAFDVVIDASESVAEKSIPRRNPGA